MHSPALYGSDYSVYVRIVRLALEEKRVAYHLVPVDIFAPGGPPAWYRERHPFLRIPAFSHAGIDLYETGPIIRYVDEAFDGPPLQPIAPGDRAAMNQIIGIVDSYAYRTLVWDIYVETVSKPGRGETTDTERVAKAVPVAETCLSELSRLKRSGRWLIGEDISLADVYLAPVLAYFEKADIAGAMLDRHPNISAWWGAMRERDSFIATEPSD